MYDNIIEEIVSRLQDEDSLKKVLKDSFLKYKKMYEKTFDENDLIRLKKDEIFLSEDDLKFSFAMAIKDLYPNAKILLEYPISTKDLYSSHENGHVETCFNVLYGNENIYQEGRESIDVCFEIGDDVYFVELKYKTSELDGKCCRYSKNARFDLKEQRAQNVACYAIYEDIERMENIKNSKYIAQNHPNKNIKTYILAISNNSGLWIPHYITSLCSNVSLTQGDTTNRQNICSKKQSVSYDELNIDYVSIRNRKNSTKDCKRPIHLNHSYNINWRPFRQVCGSQFNYLLIDLEKDINDEKSNILYKKKKGSWHRVINGQEEMLVDCKWKKA